MIAWKTAATFDPARYVDVAAGKTARQSSTIAGLPLDGLASIVADRPGNADFAFHTEEEEHPWWQVDLAAQHALAAVVVYNRRDLFANRNNGLIVEASSDGEKWTLLHAGLVCFGGGTDFPPLVVPLRGSVVARHVRLSLRERQALVLLHVEVLADRELSRAAALRAELGLSFPLRGEGGLPAHVGYTACAATPDDLGGPLIGLKITETLNFGNGIIQHSNAIALARQLKLRFVQLAAEGVGQDLVALVDRFAVDGLTIIPADEPLPGGGCCLAGSFFDNAGFPALDDLASVASHQDLIRRLVLPFYPRVNDCRRRAGAADELALHIRSGDIFSTVIHPLYVQPPLAFYELTVATAMREDGVRRVRMIFQDRLNPVVDALEARLKLLGVPVVLQSGTAEDDICTVVEARHVAFGFGTFGYAACMVSDRKEAVHYFSPDGGLPFRGMSNVARVRHVVDAAGGYIKLGDWRNSPEQRRMMVEYSADALRYVEC